MDERTLVPQARVRQMQTRTLLWGSCRGGRLRQMSALNPKERSLAELHRHLDGSLRPESLQELAARQGSIVPKDLAFSKGMGLEAALARFAFTLSVLQEPEAVRRVASEM